MTKETTNEEPVKAALNLPVEVVAVPRDNDHQLLGTASDTLPMPINVKVKIRNTAAIGHHGIVSVLKSINSKRIRLVNSDQTIMSFDLLMEDEKAKQHQKKSQNRFLQLFKAGGCLSIQKDDDMYSYMPDSSYSANKLQGRSNNINPESDNITENFSVKKHITLVESVNNTSKTPKSFLGKCKPGGCLDPPYSEEKYIYKPQIKQTQLDQENAESKSTVNEKLPDTSEVEQKSKDLSNIVIEDIYSNSLITYPILSSKESHDQEESAKKLLRSRLSNDNKGRPSRDEFSKTYFVPSKRDKNRISDTSNKDKCANKKDVIHDTQVIDGTEETVIVASPDTISPITYQTSELKVPIKVTREEPIITSQKSIERLSLQGRQLHAMIEEPSIVPVVSSQAILSDEYFKKATETSDKIVDNVESKQNYVSSHVLDENYSEDNNKLESPFNNQNISAVASLIDKNESIEQNTDVVPKYEGSKDSNSISTKISYNSIIAESKPSEPISRNSTTNQNPVQEKSEVLQTKSLDTKITTYVDVEESSNKSKSSLYSEKDVRKSISLNSALDLHKKFEQIEVLDDQRNRGSTEFKNDFINNNDITDNNNLRSEIVDSKSRDDFISHRKSSDSLQLDKRPQIEKTFITILTKSDQSLNKIESKLKSSQYSEENVIGRSNSIKSAEELQKAFDSNKIPDLNTYKESKELVAPLVNSSDVIDKNSIIDDIYDTKSKDELLAGTKYDEKLFIKEQPQLTESHSNNIMIHSDQNMYQQEVLDKVQSERSAVVADLQVPTDNLSFKKSSNEIEDINQIENTGKIDKMPFRTDVTRTSSEADSKLIVQDPQSTNNAEHGNAHKIQQNSLDDLTHSDIKYDQLNVTKKKTSNLLLQKNEVISSDTQLKEDLSTSKSRDKVIAKSVASEIENDVKYKPKESITIDSQEENLIKGSEDVKLSKKYNFDVTNEYSLSNLSSLALISKKVDQKDPIDEIQMQNSIERQSLEDKSLLQPTKENIPSFSAQNVETKLNKDDSFYTSSSQIKGIEEVCQAEKLSKSVSSTDKVPKTDSKVQKLKTLVTKENETVDLKNKRLSSVNSFVKLNLGFQSQINDRNEIEINTFDPFTDLNKYSRDNVTIVKSILRENDEAICVPVNSRMDITLQMEQSKFSKEYSTVAEKKALDKSTEISMQTDVLLQKTLNSVYESLIPVKMIIQDLIRETDALSQQQQLFKEVLNPTTEESFRLIHSNRNCSCLNRKN